MRSLARLARLSAAAASAVLLLAAGATAAHGAPAPGTGLTAPGTGVSAFPAAHLVSRIAPHRCLDVDARTLNKPRSNVQLWDCRWEGDPDQPHQLFDQLSILDRPSYEFRLRNQKSGKCLTYHPGGYPKPVWVERCDREGQGWRVQAVSGGHQFVAIQTAGLCLNVVETSGPPRAGIDLWQCAEQPHNTWTVS
ncbi:RICIN domain-containing protein [Saccharothrix australiensis]|uniref:Ricin-type beta-trefoil lectin protein n=1 Tax=Saccharothrix australiensis TaxID=2072 RepID=A0A495W548_9PSEU|nr:ricin-type beta-trefoil lectin domain protein [Saccharothrix australiensis]RKT55783.1 ricin-type beta-trefoil lectin protein [Saccharothrix australiensis]